jgi:hypothetical protein
MRIIHLSRITLALLATLGVSPAFAQDTPKVVPTAAASPSALPAGAYSLDQFGPVKSDAEAKATFKKAEDAILAAGGGVLIIPATTAPNFTATQTVQHQLRTPPAPALTKSWKIGPGITVIDLRKMGSITTPMARGFTINRTLQLPVGQSLPHWDIDPMIYIKNTILRGSTSYRDWLQEDIPGGKDQKFYVATIRGVFPGEFLNSGDYGNVERLCVKSIGYDNQKQMWYFVADCENAMHKGAMIHNKNHTNILRMDTYSHNENQTFDLMLWRHNYSQGDNYLIDARFKYMGDIHSTSGDENGALFAGFIEQHSDPFQSKVESFNPTNGRLVYDGNAKKNDTLGSGRPIINLNPKKAVTAGKVRIVRPADWWNPEADPALCGVYEGKTYPTVIAPDRTSQKVLSMGGLMRFSKDAPVDQKYAGWYFAITDESEKIPKSDQLRWYLIDSITQNPDGTKDLKIIRHWWGAKVARSVTLYKDSNYTTDTNDKPLSYIIAPGVNAYDVADGVKDSPTFDRSIKLAPTPTAGTPNDFEKGDPIVQAVGPDPFRPISFKSWLFENVPGAFPGAVMDIRNLSPIQKYAVMKVGSGAGATFADNAKRQYDQKSAFDIFFDFEATAQTGFLFRADVKKGFHFMQPSQEAAISWNYANFKEASLSVARDTGVMKLQATGLQVAAPVTQVTGLSGDGTASANLRGKNVPVTTGQTTITVKFPKPEANADYAVFIETTWLTGRAITQQTPEGFTVEFDKAPAKDAKLHWLLVR